MKTILIFVFLSFEIYADNCKRAIVNLSGLGSNSDERVLSESEKAEIELIEHSPQWKEIRYKYIKAGEEYKEHSPQWKEIRYKYIKAGEEYEEFGDEKAKDEWPEKIQNQSLILSF